MRASMALKIETLYVEHIAKDIYEKAQKLKTLDDDIVRKRKKPSSKKLAECEMKYDCILDELTGQVEKLQSRLPQQQFDGQEETKCRECKKGCWKNQQQIRVNELEKEINLLRKSVSNEKASKHDALKRVNELEKEIHLLRKSVSNEKASKDDALKRVNELEKEINLLKKSVCNEKASKDDALKRAKELLEDRDYLTRCVKEEMESNLDALESFHKLTKETISLRRRVKEEEAFKDDAEALKEDALKRINELQEEIDSLKRRVRDEEESKNDALKRVNELKEEIDSLKRRVRDEEESKSPGAFKSTLQKSCIDEISDHFRPSKLAETISEIYDQEWKDAFDEIDMRYMYTEAEMAGVLLRPLMDIFTECKRIMDGFLGKVQACIEQIDVSQVATEDRLLDLPYTLRLHIKEFRRLKTVENITGIVEAILKQQKLEHLNRPPYNSENVTEYLKKCAKVSWLMCVHDPPLVLSTKQPYRFDKTLYREYTKRGRFTDFVVWPIVYLHENGPILRKGIAQGSDQFTTIRWSIPIARRKLPTRSSPDT